MQTLKSIEKLIGAVKFNDWDFIVDTNKGVPYVQIKFYAPGSFSDSDELELQSCRKWMLSYYMCDEEIISTAFKAMLAAVEHEAREQFTWEGEAIYRPHLDIRTLHKISSENLVDKRDETDYNAKADFDALCDTTAPQQDKYDRLGYDVMGGVK